MGIGPSCIGQFGPEDFSSKEEEDERRFSQYNCLRRKQAQGKSHSHSQWYVNERPTCAQRKANGPRSLEHCFMSSPDRLQHRSNRGPKQHPTRVFHPENEEFSSFSSTESFRPGRLMKIEYEDEDEEFSSFNSSRSGRSRKRVSFRAPHEADIFIFTTDVD